MPSLVKDQLLLVALCVVIFFVNLGAAPLWDRDEPRNAGCTSEMLAHGDLVVPVFNGELRTHKPILLYWLMMLSYSAFGITEFGARAVSALAGVGSVLLTYHLARHLFNRQTALWAGVILCSTLMFSVAARAATPDSLLVFCSTLAMYCFIRGSFGRSESNDCGMPTGPWVYAMYASMGLGVLTKGPVGLVLPTAVIGMYLLIRNLPAEVTAPKDSWVRRCLFLLRPFAPMHFLRTCWQMRPVTAVLVAGVVAAPWYVWVHVRTGGVWTAEFFWLHNVSRASATMEGHSGPPILFYVAAILVGFFPWSILAIPTALHAGRAEQDVRRRWISVLLACWCGVYVGIFSLAQTKLPSYVTPCYPALALLVAQFVASWSERADMPQRWLKIGLAHWGVIGASLVVGLPAAANRWLPGSEWLGAIGLVPLVGSIICWQFVSRNQARATQVAFASTCALFVALLMTLAPAEIGKHRKDATLLSKIEEHLGTVVAYGHLEPSWIFYGGKPIREFKAEQLGALADYLANHEDALLLTTEQRIDALTSQVPQFARYDVVHQTEYFLRERDLLLLGRRDLTESVANRHSAPLAEVPGPY